jgi:REP element-mobilizing transposase RayT
MARTPRREVIDESQVGVYHCINRCVRRAYLCGEDAVSGCNYEHRKQWIRGRMEELAGIFGIDVLGYAVMSNHLHVVLRNRPDVVAEWSDEEAARRGWNMFPGRRDDDGSPAEPFDHELAATINNPDKLAEVRRRLSSLSWFMRCLCERIARRANGEDECTGRFFEGRFTCQALLDEAAVLACCVYVDLNPIRAGVACSPETSQYTSAYDRIRSRDARTGGVTASAGKEAESGGKKQRKRKVSAASPDGWLSPMSLEESQDRSPRGRSTGRRASDKGFLPMSLDDYLQLLDWTGRQVYRKGGGTIPAELAPIVQRLSVVDQRWLELVQNFGGWFRRVVGCPAQLTREAHRRNRRWLHGMSKSRSVFR